MSGRSIADRVANALSLPGHSVAAAVALLNDGNTVPFIARYRKEATGELDEVQLRAIEAEAERLATLDGRRETILASIAEQGALTDTLRSAIEFATDLTALEDLYAPHRPRRRTRATMAVERGLEPLAERILEQPTSGLPPSAAAVAYVGDEVEDVEAALAGARDIVAQAISDHPAVRGQTREKAMTWGTVRTARRGGKRAGEDPRGTFEAYYDFQSRVDRLEPHQVLAIDRGEEQNVLRVGLDVPERDWTGAIEAHFRPHRGSPWAEQLDLAVQDAAARLLLPAIERDVRRALTDAAHDHATDVFARNLRALLLRPPLVGHVVLGVDPAYRTGCKLAVVDPTGRMLETSTVYPHAPQKRWDDALRAMEALSERHDVTLIAVGNGTASRETERLVAELVEQRDGLRYLVVNEAGASVYSASDLARAELPGLDVSLRGAVSIARRAQDPLAELVKIEPKAIGVGLYQHDVDQSALDRALDGVVEDVVNAVGVDANTASPALLARVAGIGPKLADSIVGHRDQQGPYGRRDDLLAVAGIGPKTYEQAAGFLRVHGAEPLDATAIHPESYEVARRVLERAGLDASGTATVDQRTSAIDRLREPASLASLAAELDVGEPTLRDILDQLVQPGRDPRQDAPKPLLRGEAMSIDELQVGARLPGTVRNVVDFGAFVDIGVGQDGLIHRSKVGRGRTLRDLQVGHVIDVEVLSVEPDRGRIGLRWAHEG